MLFLIFVVFIHQVIANIQIETPKGTIVGQHIDNAYSVFYGIPYASVDESNRFGDAQQYPNFSTPFIASNASIICPQVQRVQGGIIQCLTLNILVPNVQTTDPLPVYVWFFGGGFIMGNASDYDGRPLAKHDIIVVTVNYRLGPYGFLCTNKIKNQGLKDQAAALRWVKLNIAAFGGDPNKVTIGGQSYGGGAVDFHLYSQEKLFSKAVIQSGSKFANGIVSKNDNSAPLKLAYQLGSNAANLNQAMKFLNKADPIEVMAASRDLKLRFGVCKENYNNVESINDVPILIGYNSKEDFGGFATKDDEFYKTLGDPFYNSLSQTFNLDDDTLKTLAGTVKSFYFGSKNVSKESMLELVDFSSDFKLNYAVERSVTNYLSLNNSKVFKYIFSYVGISPYKDIEGVGAYHTEELQFLFERGSNNFNSEQLVLMERMTTMWTNFIKYGNPNLLQADLLRDRWLPMNLEQRPYYNLDVNIYLYKHVNHHRMAFWELLWNSYGRKTLID